MQGTTFLAHFIFSRIIFHSQFDLAVILPAALVILPNNGMGHVEYPFNNSWYVASFFTNAKCWLML